MTKMSLTTFLLNDMVDTVTRTDRFQSRVSKKTQGGNYYWPTIQASTKMFTGEMSYDQAISEVMHSIDKDAQRIDNQNALKSLYDLKISKAGTHPTPPEGWASGPQGILNVSLKPPFAIKRGGKTTAYVPWMIKDTRLTPKLASVGIHLLRTHLAKGEFEKWTFAMFDTVTRTKYVRVHRNSEQAADEMLRLQEEALKFEFAKVS